MTKEKESTYEVTCCSTCDLSPEHLYKLGVPFAKYHYILNGQDHLDDLYATMSAKDFFDSIDAGAMPTTSQVTPEELCAMFEPILALGKDILHIEFSSGLSGGWQSAQAAQAEMQHKYPKRKIYIVDSLCASSGYGLLVDKAVELKRGGMDIDELRDWVEDNKLKVRHWFFTNNLTHLKRGGRVSGPSAAIGTILGICPVMDVSCDGHLIVRKKVMGKKKALKELSTLMCEQAAGGENYKEKIYLCHAQRIEDATALADDVSSKFKNAEDVEINDIGTVIGSHTGPGVVALFYFSKDKRSN